MGERKDTDAMKKFGYRVEGGDDIDHDGQTDKFRALWANAASLLSSRREDFLQPHEFRLIDILNKGPIPTEFGDWTLIPVGDQLSGTIHEVLVYGNIDEESLGDGENVPVYIAFSDHFGEVYLQKGRESSKRNLHAAMTEIKTEGRGVVISLKHDGEGRGITNELQSLNHQYYWGDDGFIHKMYDRPHEEPVYDGEQLKQILRSLGVNPDSARLIPGGIDNLESELIAFSEQTEHKSVTHSDVVRHVRSNYYRWFKPSEAQDKMKKFLEARGESILEFIGSAPLPTQYGDWTIIAFGDKSDGSVHHALVYGNVDNIDFSGKSVLARGHSACHTNENFHAENCECRKELHYTMQEIQEEGSGIILYLQQEGRGNGVVGKLDQLEKMFAWEDGKIVQREEDGEAVDTIRAYEMSGYNTEQRDFSITGEMLKFLGVNEVRLITNNKHKIEGVEKAGIKVTPVEIFIEPDNQIIRNDLKAKAGSVHYTDFYRGDGNGIVVQEVNADEIIGESDDGHIVQ